MSPPVRLRLFEVYENCQGPARLLCVTSDPAEAKRLADEPGDHVIENWWVRERSDAECHGYERGEQQ